MEILETPRFFVQREKVFNVSAHRSEIMQYDRVEREKERTRESNGDFVCMNLRAGIASKILVHWD